MTDTSNCPSCGKGIRLPVGSAGKRIKCGRCGEAQEIRARVDGSLGLVSRETDDVQEEEGAQGPGAKVPPAGRRRPLRSRHPQARGKQPAERASQSRKNTSEERDDEDAQLVTLHAGITGLRTGFVYCGGLGLLWCLADVAIDFFVKTASSNAEPAITWDMIDSIQPELALSLQGIVAGGVLYPLKSSWVSTYPLTACKATFAVLSAVTLVAFALTPDTIYDPLGWCCRVFACYFLYRAFRSARLLEGNREG